MGHPVVWFEVMGKDGKALRDSIRSCSVGRSVSYPQKVWK